MRCPQCQHDNGETAKFCEECGTRLVRTCPSCGHEVRPSAKFCPECGTALTGKRVGRRAKSGKRERTIRKPSVAPRSTLHAPRAEGERRQLTVMFCDLVGSTALSAQLDPEELHAVVQNYHAVCAKVIDRYEGHIAQPLGDGLLVYLGYPAAHEDDAQRAVRAGLEIVEAIRGQGSGAGGQEKRQYWNPRLSQPLQVRIGIHTGPVMVGEIGHGEKRELLALGETPNIAARLQALAEPNTVFISAATYQLVQGLFACKDRGPQELKGLSTPLSVYQVLSEGEVHSRFEAAVRKGLTPFIGREQEVGLLLERWERAKAGAGQVVLLSGEPGIGKSRLMQVLKERIAGESHARVECRCSPFYQNNALYPVIEHLQRLLKFGREDSPEQKLSKLERALERYGFPLPEVMPLFASLLSLPPSRFPLPVLTPQKQKQKTLEALVTWLLKEAEHQPVRLDMEDLHWADPSTIEFLTLLIDQVPTTRILILLTFRPEFRPPWTMRSHLTRITLNRLPPTQAGEMVARVAGGKALPAELVQQVIAKTDGVPLFVEELTKMVLESGGDVGARRAVPLPLGIPATLQDALMARLDRLGTAKEVAQLGATLGREFPYELIQAVSSFNEDTLQKSLAQLVEAELLYQRGLPPQARYIFKHALIQDAAYQSLLKSKRQQLHQRIAQVLEEQFGEIKETQPELLAHHYTEAGLIAQAIPYWQKAGQRAVERSAHVEATAHLTKGLELLKTLLDTPERTQQELALQTTLGSTLIAIRGWAAPEVERAYTRALELCRQVEEPRQLFPVLWGLWAMYIVQAECRMAHELGEQLLSSAQSLQDPALLLQAHFALGNTSFWRGELAAARSHLEQGIALYDPQQHRSLASLYAVDPGMFCRGYATWVLWHLGFPGQALKLSYETLTFAQDLSHPQSLALALLFASVLHLYRREEQAAQERAEATIALSNEQGFPFYLAWGTIVRGWTLVEQGQRDEGIAQMRQGWVAHQATGAKMAGPHLLALPAEAYGKAGRVEEGLAVLAEALAIGDKTEERYYEAELYRLKGQLTLQKFQVSGFKFQVENSSESGVRSLESEAEECFQQAIAIARKQQAKSLELRATVSLARLWQQQGKHHEARNILSGIYSWFTEGFDTADLKEAKALLDEL